MMKIPPIEVIASWPRPNYISPESRAPIGRTVGLILEVLVTVVLAIRLYSRKRLTKGFGLDDTLICLAYIPVTAFTLTGIISQDLLQWGRHIWDVEPKFLSSNLLVYLIHLLLFDLATSLTKLSMLAMVRRLTSASSGKAENVIVLLLAALITANCFIFTIVEIFQCWPVSSAWMISERSYYCINEEAHLIAANIINTITDFVVVLLPIRTVVKLRLSPRQRVIVIGLFGIGLIASSVGIIRTYFTWLLFTAADHDVTWRSWYVWLSSLLELHLSIVCASIPATKPFFAGYAADMRQLTRKRQKSTVISEPSLVGGNRQRGRPSRTSLSSLSLILPNPENGTGQERPLPPTTDPSHSLRRSPDSST